MIGMNKNFIFETNFVVDEELKQIVDSFISHHVSLYSRVEKEYEESVFLIQETCIPCYSCTARIVKECGDDDDRIILELGKTLCFMQSYKK